MSGEGPVDGVRASARVQGEGCRGGLLTVAPAGSRLAHERVVQLPACIFEHPVVEHSPALVEQPTHVGVARASASRGGVGWCRSAVLVYGHVTADVARAMEADMEGWWCVRHGDALACVEAPSAPEALRRSLDLHAFGDWTDDARELVVFPQDAYPENAGPHDYTRAVLRAHPSPLRRRGSSSRFALTCVAAVAALGLVAGASAETWRGLTVAPEHRCAPYDKKRDYPYPQSVERHIVRELGAVYGPYTGTCFASARETDIEHIVAASEAHDSGLCAADAATKARFARDLTQPHARLTAGEPAREERQGRCGVGSGSQPLLVRSARRRRPAGLRAHHRPARGRGAQAHSCSVREHGA